MHVSGFIDRVRVRLNIQYSTLFAIVCMFYWPIRSMAIEEMERIGEYDLKAVYLYKMIKFIDWPDGAFEETGNRFIICIVGKDPFPLHFYAKEGERVREKSLTFHRRSPSGSLRGCHVIYLSIDDIRLKREVLRRVLESPVLTVSDNSKFVDMGGVIGFVMRSQHVKIEINLDAAKRASIKIRAQLMEIATRIVDSNIDSKDRR